MDLASNRVSSQMINYPSLADVLAHPVDLALKLGTQTQYPYVLHDRNSYIQRTPRYKIVKKFLHKFLYMLLRKQLHLFREKLDFHSKILVLYTGKDSFGDANMELSGRALLKGKYLKIDLLTLPKLHPQFKEDDIFKNVYTRIEDIDVRSYDAVLLAEFNHKSLRLKNKYFAQTPFACLFGYFDGPARNQSCFSHAAFNSIFSLEFDAVTLLNVSKPYLHCSKETINSIETIVPRQAFLALSIGGVDPYRTYKYWDKLLHLLDQQSDKIKIVNILLVGSDNGRSTAKKLLEEKFDHLKIVSQVAELNILQTRALIGKADLFVGCDGGLMHVAHSTSTSTVALFSEAEPYEYWTTAACRCHAIQSSGNVSKIPPEKILSSIHTALDKV